MPSGHDLPVAVGVDGSATALHAVTYAAAEAQRLGVGLRVVHVTPVFMPPPPLRPVPGSPSYDAAHQIVRTAAHHAQAVAPDLHVELEIDQQLVTGSRASALVAAARTARLVVLGSETGGLLERIVTGEVVVGVASRATCPVVVVPSTWRREETFGRVVVGFEDAVRSAGVLAAGFAHAEERGVELEVVHAWRMPVGYDDVVEARVASEAYREQTFAAVEPEIARLRARHPGVEVTVQDVHGQAAAVLVAASTRADLLVLVRRDRGPGITHLGGTGRAVLRHGRCPVEVLARSAPDLVAGTELAAASNR